MDKTRKFLEEKLASNFSINEIVDREKYIRNVFIININHQEDEKFKKYVKKIGKFTIHNLITDAYEEKKSEYEKKSRNLMKFVRKKKESLMTKSLMTKKKPGF